MAKETAEKQTRKKSSEAQTAEETVKKSPKKAEEKSIKSVKKEDTVKKASKKEDAVKSSPEKTEEKSDKSAEKEEKSAKKSDSKNVKEEKSAKKSDSKNVKEESKKSSAKADYKAKKTVSEKNEKSSKSSKDSSVKYTGRTSKKMSDAVENTQYNPYKNKAKISFKGFLICFLIIAFFLTLNQFVLHIPGVPTWESIFAENIPEYSVAVGEMQVHFIDVGQGDSTLIVTKEKTVLIDSGETEYDGVVLNYIKSLGITRLDYIIGSHPHSDHIGSMSKVVDGLEVGEIILPKMTKDMIPATKCYTDLLQSADKKKVKIRSVRGGEKITLTEGCVIDILAPVSDYDDLNNYSITCKLIHGENSFLFTGDIETSAEYDIVESGADLSADVIKVPHHGSATSSSYKFLKAVRPTYAVFHVGSPNDYGHPNDAVYKRYKEFDCKRYRTDMNGNIIFKSNGTELTIETENKNGHV